MPRVLSFDRRRFKVFAALLALVYGLAFGGVWAGLVVPFLGGALFIAGLMVWYLPGVLFAWTGLFAYHESSAPSSGSNHWSAPNGRRTSTSARSGE